MEQAKGFMQNDEGNICHVPNKAILDWVKPTKHPVQLFDKWLDSLGLSFQVETKDTDAFTVIWCSLLARLLSTLVPTFQQCCEDYSVISWVVESSGLTSQQSNMILHLS